MQNTLEFFENYFIINYTPWNSFSLPDDLYLVLRQINYNKLFHSEGMLGFTEVYMIYGPIIVMNIILDKGVGRKNYVTAEGDEFN